MRVKDGCSGGMSWAADRLGIVLPWESCCDDHDLLYAAGGPVFLRRVADRRLRECVADNGWLVLGWAMWAAVRVWGGPFWPVPWRWGFDCEYGEGYRRSL